jgi:hypothetical protein
LESAEAEKKPQDVEDISALEAVPALTEHDEPASIWSLMTHQVVITMANYAFSVFMDSASSALNPLVYASPISYGGLGLSSFDIGIIMSISGIMLGLGSTVLFPVLTRKLGLKKLYRICFAGHLIIQPTYVLMNMTARHYGCVNRLVWMILVVQLSVANLTVMTYSRCPPLRMDVTIHVLMQSLSRLNVHLH